MSDMFDNPAYQAADDVPPPEPPADDPPPGKGEKRSIATQLVDMVRDEYTLGIGDDGTPYGCLPDAPHIALPLRGGKLGLRAELARRWFDKHNTAPNATALADACAVLEGFAARERARELHLRVAGHGGNVYIDTADDDGRVIAIADGRWRIANDIPVLFRRTALTAPLPEPAEHGELSRLWRYVAIDDDDRPVLIAWLLAALVQPSTPHPVLGLVAEHGSAKSTATRLIVSLVDPSIAPLRMPPRDIDQWVTGANGSWIVAIDNMSGVADWLSDALCRAATGDALPKRALYTDADIAVLKFRRCVILNGIDLGGLNGDLSDRLALVNLRRITEDNRRDETELDKSWSIDRPVILRGLLDLAATVHKMLPSVGVPGGMPRMADYGKVLAAVDQVGKTKGLVRYRERHDHLAADSIAADSFAAELVRSCYRGEDVTAATVLAALTPGDKGWRRPRDWPRNARATTGRLTRHAPALRSQGWTVEHDAGRNKAKVTRWSITPPQPDGGDGPKGAADRAIEDTRKTDPPDPPNPPNGHSHRSDTVQGRGPSDEPGLFTNPPITRQHPPNGLNGSVAGQKKSLHPPKKPALTSEGGPGGSGGSKIQLTLGHHDNRPCADGHRGPVSAISGCCDWCG